MSKRSAAGHVAAGAAYTVQGNPLPYLVPAVGAVANLVLAGFLSLAWGAYAQHPAVWDIAWRSALLVAVSAALIVVTWAAGRARQAVLRSASLGVAALSCMWTFVLTFQRWSFDKVMAYLLTMLVACLCLAVIRILRGDGTDPGNRVHAFGAVAERVNELKAVGELGRPKVIDGVVKTRVKMEPGEEFAQLSRAQGAIATLVPTAKTNIRLVPDRNNPGEGDMEITARDYIAEPPPWPGLSEPGGSIAAPIRLMVYGTGLPVPFHLFGDQELNRNAIGLLVVAGQPGAGKTELMLGLAAEVLSRSDTELTVIDARKGEQLPDWLEKGAQVITDMEAAESFIAGLVDDVSARAGVLGRAGFKQWAQGCPLKAKVVLLDEAAKLVASRNEEEMVELAESVRSVGILLVLFQQRVTTDRLPSSVKKARGGSICLGVADDREAGRILSESTMEAGASPGSLGNREPGSLWCELPGIPEEDWSRKARTYRPPSAAELAAAVAPFVEGYEPPPAPARRGDMLPAAEEGELVDDDDDRLDRRDDDRGAPAEPADPEVEREAGDPRDPIVMPDRPRITFEHDGGDRQWTKGALMDLIGSAILDAYAQGHRRIKPSNLSGVVAYVGADNLKPPRLSGYLGEMCEPGPLRLLRRDRDSGFYVIDPGEGVRVPELANT